MKRFSTLIACLVLFTASHASAQLSGVDGYTVTPFQAKWDSLTTVTATVATYEGGTNDGKYQIALPFAFPYDGVTLPEGTMIGVGANGAISLTNSAMPAGQLVGDLDHPMLIGPFNGDIKQGSDKQAGVSDTLGFYRVSGNAPDRTLTIEFRAFHLRGGGSGAGKVDTLTSMQVKLYETSGIIEFIYRDHGLDLPSKFATPPLASIGLNGGLAPSFRKNVLISDTKIIPETDLRWIPGTASVDLTNDSKLVQVYPNPTANRIRINMLGNEVLQHVTAFDGVGRAHSLSFDSNGFTDLSVLVAGNYLLRIETNDRVHTAHVSIVR